MSLRDVPSGYTVSGGHSEVKSPSPWRDRALRCASCRAAGWLGVLVLTGGGRAPGEHLCRGCRGAGTARACTQLQRDINPASSHVGHQVEHKNSFSRSTSGSLVGADMWSMRKGSSGETSRGDSRIGTIRQLRRGVIGSASSLAKYRDSQSQTQREKGTRVLTLEFGPAACRARSFWPG